MKKLYHALVMLTLFGIMCLGSGCDRFGDAVLDGLSGAVSDVAADLISGVLPLGSDS
ncbi:MAG: hypothetical protein IH988_01485 [Planctomycetes bacterium]|nr:hypothetical protein [Planctomycetota bacterium]